MEGKNFFSEQFKKLQEDGQRLNDRLKEIKTKNIKPGTKVKNLRISRTQKAKLTKGSGKKAKLTRWYEIKRIQEKEHIVSHITPANWVVFKDERGPHDPQYLKVIKQ